MNTQNLGDLDKEQDLVGHGSHENVYCYTGKNPSRYD